jgi:retron-type reverse transcriptase
MRSILWEKIHDGRFLRLVQNMLTAGYLEDWRWNATLSGAPQGGVVSPILSSIYLHKLDTYVETVLIPQYTKGKAGGATLHIAGAGTEGACSEPGRSGQRPEASA